MSLSKIEWVADFRTPIDRIVLIFIIFQCLAFVQIVITSNRVLHQSIWNTSRFWIVSTAGVFMLTPVPLFEIGFTLAFWTKQTLWGWPPYMTLIADILVRLGYATITLCRFWRLKLISPSRPITADKLFRFMSLLVIFATIINLYSSASLRTIEYITGEFAVVSFISHNPRVIWFREQDKYLGLITFLIVHGSNFICDIIFARIMLHSLVNKSPLSYRQYFSLLGPYIIPGIVTSAYSICAILSIVWDNFPFTTYFSIGLNRLAPIVESFSFYNYSIYQTRMLLGKLCTNGSNYSHANRPSAGQVAPGP